MSKEQRYVFLKERISKYRNRIKKCPVCNGEGHIPTGNMIDNVTMEYERCKCYKEFMKVKRYILSGMPRKRFDQLSQKLNNIKVINTLNDKKIFLYKKVVIPYLEKFDKAREDGLGLMFFGSTGNGKTTASLYIIHNLLIKGYDCYYILLKDLIGLLIEGYGDPNKAALFKEIIAVDFLVVDELTLVGRVTPHMIAEFTSICKSRFEDEKPTLLISNYKSVDELSLAFGAPLESLLNEAFAPFRFPSNDLREDKYAEMRRFFE